MKDIKIKKVFFLLILSTLISCNPGLMKDDLNGGIENTYSEENLPVGWYHNNVSGRYAKLVVDKNISHSGDNSILISILPNHPSGSNNYDWIRRFDSFEKDSIYELSGWIKIEKINNSPYIDIECWYGDKLIGKASTLDKYQITGTMDWVKVSTIFKVPKSTSKITVRAGVNSASNNGARAWFDDIRIVKINK